jgi:hypothetical protein
MKLRTIAVLLPLLVPLPASAGQAEDEAFIQCIVPKIQSGKFSSYDGKSVNAILIECTNEWDAWLKACLTQKPDKRDCGLVSMMVVQTELDQFRKYTLFSPGAENPWVKLYENCL